jgi:hypothetical protein
MLGERACLYGDTPAAAAFCARSAAPGRAYSYRAYSYIVKHD